MSRIAQSPRNPNVVEDDLRSQGLLKEPLQEICKFTDPEIKGLFLRFPVHAEFRDFDASALSDSLSRTWICFPALPFQLGYSYPFPAFTQSFFSATGISYSQAMPMLWRTLYTIEEILKVEDVDLGLSELAYMYTLVTHGSHRFLFKSKPHQPIPVFKTTQNDTLWRNQFFFVRRDSIPGGKSLPLRWIKKVENFSKFAEGEGVAKKVEAFLKLDPIIHTFKPRVPDSVEEEIHEATATHSPVKMSSAQKSGSKSIAKFSLEDFEDRDLPKSEKKESSKSLTISGPRQINTRAKSTATKRKKFTLPEDDFYVRERQIHEVVSEVMDGVKNLHENALRELQQSLVEIRTTAASKDKTISKLAKEKKELEEEKVEIEARMEEAVKEAVEEAKNSTFRSILQARIKIVKQAMDPDFDRSNWKLAEWEQAVVDLGDKDEVLAATAEVGPSQEGKGDEAMVAGDGADDGKVGDEGCEEKA